MNGITSCENSEEWHIASLVLLTHVDQIVNVRNKLNLISGVEIHVGADIGKWVVTVEADTASNLMNRIDAIKDIEGVLSAQLVYQQIESEAFAGENTHEAYP